MMFWFMYWNAVAQYWAQVADVPRPSAEIISFAAYKQSKKPSHKGVFDGPFSN
jgi:hypothetical protein